MTYGIRIEAPRNKYAQAVASMKRYGGQYDSRTKMWQFDERPHAATTNWGTIVELDDDDATSIDQY